MNDTKWLAFQSLNRSQSLLNSINTLISFLKLESNNENDVFTKEEASRCKDALIVFLTEVKGVVEPGSHTTEGSSLYGIDTRFNSLVQNFKDARDHNSIFKSNLFRTKIDDTINSLRSEPLSAKPELIASLQELESVIEAHEVEDYKNVIGDI